jgi:hypothetical protein
MEVKIGLFEIASGRYAMTAASADEETVGFLAG